MRDAPLSDVYRGTAWRVVEAQHKVSTLKLVDTMADQALLEDILEETKPPLPVECRSLHYLLSTPFRYRPYPHGSRFRRPGLTPGVFYAAEAVETAIAETAFYRLLFFAESPGTPLPRNAADHTAFAVSLEAQGAVDLLASPYVQQSAKWLHPTDYSQCQDLADRVRDAGAEIIRYQSVRDPAQGANLAVLTCRAFAEPAPSAWQSWKLYLGRTSVQAWRDFPPKRLEYARAQFASDPRLS